LIPQDEGAAGVGVVETTNEPTPYEHPDFSHLKICFRWNVGNDFTRH